MGFMNQFITREHHLFFAPWWKHCMWGMVIHPITLTIIQSAMYIYICIYAVYVCMIYPCIDKQCLGCVPLLVSAEANIKLWAFRVPKLNLQPLPSSFSWTAPPMSCASIVDQNWRQLYYNRWWIQAENHAWSWLMYPAQTLLQHRCITLCKELCAGCSRLCHIIMFHHGFRRLPETCLTLRKLCRHVCGVYSGIYVSHLRVVMIVPVDQWTLCNMHWYVYHMYDNVCSYVYIYMYMYIDRYIISEHCQISFSATTLLW